MGQLTGIDGAWDKDNGEKPDWMVAGHNSDGKADTGKAKMSLMHVQFGDLNRQVAEVLTFGEAKYPKDTTHDSWRDVPKGKMRYTDALYRHLHEYFVNGEELDSESGKHHFAHAIANLHFIFEKDKGEATEAWAEFTKE